MTPPESDWTNDDDVAVMFYLDGALDRVTNHWTLGDIGYLGHSARAWRTLGVVDHSLDWTNVGTLDHEV